MRYYNIRIDGAPGDIFPARYENGAQWGTIAPNGVHTPNAQQIEFQIEEWTATAPSENSVITIYGVSWDQIKASNQLVDKIITIYGGMSPGLPLATFQSQRDKLLVQAKILKCWGNWIGNETSLGFAIIATGAKQAAGSGATQPGASPATPGTSINAPSTTGQVQSVQFNRVGRRSLDFRSMRNGVSPTLVDPGSILTAIGGQILSDFNLGPATSQVGGMVGSFFGGGSFAPLSAPINMIHNMLPNMPMSSAIQQTLSTAFPQANVNVVISDALKLMYQDAGMYQSVEQYAGYIQKLSQSIMGSKQYPGVQLTSYNQTLTATDFTKTIGTSDINYLELIGQPTWLTIVTISVKVVLRGGLHISWGCTLPQTLVGFSGADAFAGGPAPDQRTHITLPGDYVVTRVLHIGDFRNPDGAAWSTNYEMITTASVPSSFYDDLKQRAANPNVQS